MKTENKFDDGFWDKGKACPFKHVNKELCSDYLYGFCIKGPNCLDVHLKLPSDPDELNKFLK